MKAALCCTLLCAVAAVLAHESQGPGFDQEVTYTYEVQGHVVAGAGYPQSQSQSQHEGLQVAYKVKITRGEDNSYYLKPQQFRAMKNCQNQCEENKTKQIAPEVLQVLESPIQVSFRNGKVQTIRFEQGLPNWGVNMKKSQLALFVFNENASSSTSSAQQEKTVYGSCNVQYKTLEVQDQDNQQQRRQQQNQNQNQQQNQQQQQQRQQQQQQQQQGRFASNKNAARQNQDDSNENSSESQENENPGIFSRLASYLPGSGSSSEQDSEEQAQKKFCGRNDQSFQIVKKYAVSDCSQTPFSANSTQQNAAQQANFKNRFVVARYFACGPSRQNYQIIRIQREEQNRGQNQQDSAEVAQNAVLVDISSASRRQERVKRPDFFVNLAYNFNSKQLQQFQQPYANQPELQQQLQQAQREEQQESGQNQHQWRWQQQAPLAQQQQQQEQYQSGTRQIIVYLDALFQGKSSTIDIMQGSCTNLPDEFNNAISSVDAGRSCFILYENKGCTGYAIRLERYSFGSQNLSFVHLDNAVSSISRCQ